MAKRIFVLIFLSAIALSANAVADNVSTGTPRVIQSGDLTFIDRNGNHVEFQKVSDMSGDYRIFGININQQVNSPIGYIDAFVPMLSLARVKELYKQSGPKQCEAEAAKEQKIISVIFATEEIKNQFLSYQDKPRHGHFALNIAGTMMKKTQDLYKGASMAGMTSKGPVSIDSVLLITKADIVPWE